MRPSGERKPLMVINQLTMSTTVKAVDVTSIDNFAEALEANVNISYVRTAKLRIASLVERNPVPGHVKSIKGKMVGAEALARQRCQHKGVSGIVCTRSRRGGFPQMIGC